MSKLHTYTIPKELGSFRSLTATEDAAHRILGQICYEKGYVIAEEMSYQNGEAFLSVWDSDHPEYDDEDAICKITRKAA